VHRSRQQRRKERTRAARFAPLKALLAAERLSDLVAEIRELDARLAKLTAQMSKTPTEHGSRLIEVDGIGPVVATRLLGRTGQAGRFPTSSAFASHAGIAPVEVASADRTRHRRPRGAGRQLNLALHIAGGCPELRGTSVAAR
jgi:transposase